MITILGPGGFSYWSMEELVKLMERYYFWVDASSQYPKTSWVERLKEKP